MNKLLSPGLAAAVFFSVAVSISAPCAAQSAFVESPRAPNHAGFAFGSPAGEALFALGIGLSNLSSRLPQRDTGWGPDAPHPYDRAADIASDFTGAYGGAAIAIGAGYALDAAYFGDAGVSRGPAYALHGALVDLESAGLARGVVDALKRLSGRCRPRHFVDGACTSEVRDAFPSGHTAPMAAIAGARLVIASQTAGPAGFRWASFGLAEAFSLSTAWLRVRAGMHSWSDVATGFILGHTLGVLVALAHPMRPVDRADLSAPPENTAQGGFAMSWGGSF